MATDLQGIVAEWDAKAGIIETMSIPLEKSDIAIEDLSLLWVPVR